MQAHQIEFRLTSMCRVLKVHRSGYYAWLREPLSPRAKANEKLTSQIREFYDQSMGIYGSPRIFCDLKEAVLDLHSRAVVGWSMGSHMRTSLVLDALTMAVWRRKPQDSVIIHTDQGSQFGSDEFNRWCKDNRLSPSMSRKGNCWDNAVAESFFSSLKSERVKKRIYQTRAEAKSEIFDYIEVFYNRVRRHKHLDQLSPHEFERQRQTAL